MGGTPHSSHAATDLEKKKKQKNLPPEGLTDAYPGKT
jgi:hypothetical protein